MALIWERVVHERDGTTFVEVQYEDDPANANFLRIYAVRWANSDPVRRFFVRVVNTTDPNNHIEVFYAEILPNTATTTYTFPKNKRPVYDNLSIQGGWLDAATG